MSESNIIRIKTPEEYDQHNRRFEARRESDQEKLQKWDLFVASLKYRHDAWVQMCNEYYAKYERAGAPLFTALMAAHSSLRTIRDLLRELKEPIEADCPCAMCAADKTGEARE